jgi:RimJ/RimL family protein N-acetyltransferase
MTASDLPGSMTTKEWTTDHLAFRRFTHDDFDLLVELDSDPAVMRYLSGGTATPPEVIRSEILPRVLGSYTPGDGFGVWAAFERRSGIFLGWISLTSAGDSHPREARLGFRLRRAAWGKGYATEGATALVRRGFTKLGLERIGASTYEHNLASRRVMEKVGMRLVLKYRPTPETLRSTAMFDSSAHSEVWEGDEVEYAINREQWERASDQV